MDHKNLNIEGFEIYYEIFNEASSDLPILYIGGAFQDYRDIQSLVKKSGKKTIIIYLPGFGPSLRTPDDFRKKQYAKITHQFLKTLKIKKTDVIGSSYGSHLAWILASDYPEYVNKLILAACSSISHVDKNVINNIYSAIEIGCSGDTTNFSERTLDVLMNKHFSSQITKFDALRRKLSMGFKKFSRYQIESLKRNTEILFSEDISLVKPPRCKTLFVGGEYDHFTTPLGIRKTQLNVPNSHLILIKNADHLFPYEKTDAVYDLYISFLQGTLSDQV